MTRMMPIRCRISQSPGGQVGASARPEDCASTMAAATLGLRSGTTGDVGGLRAQVRDSARIPRDGRVSAEVHGAGYVFRPSGR